MSYPNDTSLFTPEQVSERWQGKIKPSTLAQWRSGGTGPPYIKIGNKVFYREEALIRWEKKQERKK